MKKICALLIFIALSGSSQAQRFFYIDKSSNTGLIVKNALSTASQYLTPSPISSDYIINSNISAGEENNQFVMQIEMRDSVTLKTIYQSSETYTVSPLNTKTRIWMGLTVRSFIGRNVPKMIACARQGHLDNEGIYLKARKDKT